MIPTLSPAGFLPLGRHSCTIEELEQTFVLSPPFSTSSTRAQCLADFRSAKTMLDQLHPALVEANWIGGSFTTAKVDPDDLDSLFIIRESAFDELGSNNKKRKVLEFGKSQQLRKKLGLRVDAFMFVRQRIPQPWRAGGIDPEFQSAFALRGAWDDWWQRSRRGPDKDDAPTIESSDPVRGYLEVNW
ncbi:DUF6932 family protein [Kineosporia babensis]|uniref:Uncharacterized protein n=1 Tax=Kineosporia babensis TaxID=499548 RepID=A0A9X1SXG2_9ACTN|nr:hypothetical protein [Kineosporia babensis]MCD5315851.1 hypothetical protein [Kineosporia babensis]